MAVLPARRRSSSQDAYSRWEERRETETSRAGRASGARRPSCAGTRAWPRKALAGAGGAGPAAGRLLTRYNGGMRARRAAERIDPKP